jgi:hypothetical protein
MLIRSLKNYQPINLIIFLAISIFVWLKPILNASLSGIYIDPTPTPVYGWIVHLIGSPQLSLICKLIAFILVVLQGVIFNGILNQYNLLGFRSYLPGIFFVLLSSNFVEYQILHPILFSNLLLLFAWERIISTYEKTNTFEAYFNASLLIGLASLFYPNYIYFLLIIFLSIGMNRVGHGREYAMILAGFLTVWYFYLCLFYFFTSSLQLSGIEFDFSFSFPKYSSILLSQKIILIYLILLTLFASLQLLGFISNLKIPMRRNLKFLFLWFWVGIFLLVFTKSSLEIIYICSIPIAALLSMFFINIKNKWLSEILWLLFIICIIINYAFPNLLNA